MWILADADGNIARDEAGDTVPAAGGMPACFIDPPVTTKRRRTDTGVRDEFVVHFTGRQGRLNSHLPAPLQALTPPQRIFKILQDRALLAVQAFGRHRNYPVICFCEGDQAARANLMTGARYDRYGIAFHRQAVEGLGSRPVIYTDADVIELFYTAIHQYWRDHRDELSEDDERRLKITRAPLMRNWPGAEEDQAYLQEHRLSFELRNPNEWSHEHEMRLVMPRHSSGSAWGTTPNIFYWLFEPNRGLPH
ncbi:MAG: hypothetical protein KY469_06485 [Actinobacteria bacterium]|nr:hypothetical protein [Actinomycetota bacterium]